jgi:hypothetical protein
MSVKDDPADVTKTGFRALMSGEDHALAGSFKNEVQAPMAHVLSDTVTAEMHRKQADRSRTNVRAVVPLSLDRVGRSRQRASYCPGPLASRRSDRSAKREG